MIKTNFFLLKITNGIKFYPITSSLLAFNIGTYFFSKAVGTNKAREHLLTNSTERYLNSDTSLFNTDYFIRNFTHIASSLNEENLVINFGVFILVARNFEIMFGTSAMSRILIFNYIFQTISEIKNVYFSNFVPPKEYNPSYSIPLSLAFIGYTLPINIFVPIRLGLFIFTIYAIFNYSDVHIANALLSSFLTMFFLKNRYKLL